MALKPQQRASAQLIMRLARQRGVSAKRARELVAASYAESGLNPSARNPSGASGLFQLLSQGYVQKARAGGGVFNPRANTLAILPDYINYWRSHPNALPGEAARDVERSGMGAGFYSKPLGLLGALGSSSLRTLNTVAPNQGGDLAADMGRNGTLLTAYLNDAPLEKLLPLLQRQRAGARADARVNPRVDFPPAAERGAVGLKGITELFYDPLGGFKNGRQIGAIGGHSDHVHVAAQNAQRMLLAIRLAQQMGLHVSENPYVDRVDPVHTKNSYHYRRFPGLYNGRSLGEALDVSGPAAAMAAYYRRLAR